MTLHIYAGFNTADIGTFSVTVGGTVGSGTCTLPAGLYAHTVIAALGYGVQLHSALAASLQSRLNITPGIGTGWTVTYSLVTDTYTISNATAFTLTWPDAYLMQTLGFTANVTSTTSATSTVRPYYVIVPRINGLSNYSDVYEGDDDIVTETVGDDGTAYSVAVDRVLTGPLYCDWQHAVETREACFARHATSSVPWTWQHFFMHCRAEHPFRLYDDSAGTSTYHKLRGNFATFGSSSRKSLEVDYHAQWNIELRTRQFST